ncbi:unnamed protein product [Cyprideis torosa]|uniref:N-glycosylase/DNA lyase n=1 Tax=Cyprideis torosa TaxID=163714 RepID=A0A7R8W2H8_9CRUS|nr:unnamed protein product [Cyprideis torosa]CAG0879782.1 unnamed protein product [Cyprideis torosa]
MKIIKIPLPSAGANSLALHLQRTLHGGQCFRWKRFLVNSLEIWRGIVNGEVWWLRLSTQTNVLFCQIDASLPVSAPDAIKKIVTYFRLETSIANLYDKWAKIDPNFKKVCDVFQGIRVLDQEPVENTISFICSSNNNIPRITQMVSNLCAEFGSKIPISLPELKTFFGVPLSSFSPEDQEELESPCYSFPDLDVLAKPEVEERLRELGFGYRAKFVQGASKEILRRGGREWLMSLRAMAYPEAHAELVSLPGIGAKVADCVCLMGLGHLEAVPVDVHVLSIARTHYPKALSGVRETKGLSKAAYQAVGNFFRDLYGEKAGWAQAVLFCADLKSLNPPTPDGIPCHATSEQVSPVSLLTKRKKKKNR